MTIVMKPSCWHQNFGPNGLSASAQGLCLNFFSSIKDFNISSALRWAIQDQWSSGSVSLQSMDSHRIPHEAPAEMHINIKIAIPVIFMTLHLSHFYDSLLQWFDNMILQKACSRRSKHLCSNVILFDFFFHSVLQFFVFPQLCVASVSHQYQNCFT